MNTDVRKCHFLFTKNGFFSFTRLALCGLAGLITLGTQAQTAPSMPVSAGPAPAISVSGPPTASPPDAPPAATQPPAPLSAITAGSTAPGNPTVAVEATATTPAPPADKPEGCRILTDRAMGADLKAATAQSQKSDPVVLGKLLDESIGLWTLAIERCTDRAQDRARRNLADSQRSRQALEAETGAGPECASRQKDATSLQELAQQAVRERRWLDASVMYRKAENMWDVASERCTGEPQRLALLRRDQTATDAHNAEFCAPTFERAREHTQTLTRQGDSTDKAARQQQQQVAETLWRDAMNQCKGPALDIARNNAQRLAKERGTPWVPTAAPDAPVRTLLPATAPATAGTVAAAPGAATPPVPAGTVGTLAVAAAPVGGNTRQPPAPGSGSTAAVSVPPAPAAAANAPQMQDIQSGDTRFQGQFVREGSLLSGQGKVTWANGDVYQGELSQNRRHGQGEFTWANGQRYRGTWVNDVPQGKGSLKFASGNQYDGDVAQGLPHGTGRMVYASGDSFQGRFLQGKPDGSGTYRWASGQTYEGPWSNDQPNGKGVLAYATGNRYEGNLLNGTPDGSGTLTYASGDVYSGLFSQGSPHGEGTYTWKSGERYSGQWQHGLKHGQGRFEWANGDRWEGQFENDAQTVRGTLTRKSP